MNLSEGSHQLSLFNGHPGIENLVIGGVLTEGAPETTARGAGERGYSVFLIEDACASLSPDDHAATFSNLAWCVPRSTDELLELLQQLPTTTR